MAQMVKNLPENAGDLGSIPGLGRSPGEGNGYPLLYSCLENSMDRGAWRATVHGVKWRFSVALNSVGLETGMPSFGLLDKILEPCRSGGSETKQGCSSSCA